MHCSNAIGKVPGVEPASVNNGIVPAGDALEIHVDPAGAALENMTPADVEAQVDQYLQGTVVTRYIGAAQDVGVRVWLDPTGKIGRDKLGQLPSPLSSAGDSLNACRYPIFASIST